MKPTFHRIAISTPQVFATLTTTQLWVDYAAQHRADALLIRDSSLDWSQKPLILDFLAKTGLPLLLNVNVPNPIFHSAVLGFHFKDGKTPSRFGKFSFYGQSCHDLAGIQRAMENGMDYVFYSPVFETNSHENQPPKGLAQLKRACEFSSIPVFALGGINAANETACLNVGAFGIAAITWFLPPQLQSNAFHS